MLQIVIAEGLEGATVILALSRSLLVDDLLAVPRLVVVSLTLLTEHMSDVVSVVLVEFIAIDALLCEFLPPELHCLVHGQSDSFQEKTELQSSEML